MPPDLEGESGRESNLVFRFAKPTNLQQPRLRAALPHAKTNCSLQKIDGGVRTISGITRLHCVKLRGRHVAQCSVNGVFPSPESGSLNDIVYCNAPEAEHCRNATGGSFPNFEPLADCELAFGSLRPFSFRHTMTGGRTSKVARGIVMGSPGRCMDSGQQEVAQADLSASVTSLGSGLNVPVPR